MLCRSQPIYTGRTFFTRVQAAGQGSCNASRPRTRSDGCRGSRKKPCCGRRHRAPARFFAAQEAVRGSSQYRRTSYTKFPAFWLALLSVPLRLVQLEIALAGCRHHLIETQGLRGARISIDHIVSCNDSCSQGRVQLSQDTTSSARLHCWHVVEQQRKQRKRRITPPTRSTTIKCAASSS